MITSVYLPSIFYLHVTTIHHCNCKSLSIYYSYFARNGGLQQLWVFCNLLKRWYFKLWGRQDRIPIVYVTPKYYQLLKWPRNGNHCMFLLLLLDKCSMALPYYHSAVISIVTVLPSMYFTAVLQCITVTMRGAAESAGEYVLLLS